MWKQAHSALSLQSPNPLIICILDGNDTIFNYSFIRQGHSGGQQAARQLTQGIAQHLAGEDLHLIGSLSFWILNMVDKNGLIHTLLERNICSADDFQAFLTGFSQASTRFSMIDTGSLENGTFLKVQGERIGSCALCIRDEGIATVQSSCAPLQSFRRPCGSLLVVCPNLLGR